MDVQRLHGLRFLLHHNVLRGAVSLRIDLLQLFAGHRLVWRHGHFVQHLPGEHLLGLRSVLLHKLRIGMDICRRRIRVHGARALAIRNADANADANANAQQQRGALVHRFGPFFIGRHSRIASNRWHGSANSDCSDIPKQCALPAAGGSSTRLRTHPTCHQRLPD